MLTQVGKYQILEKIGVGGFGSVYKGRDPFIKRSVAIKTCQSDEDEIKKRFFREAEFAGNLHHRNVTTIYDFGVTDEGVPYIVQEFLTGEDLDRKIKNKEAMPLARKVRILMDLCDGLGYAHEKGIIHRDIKPSNVRILEDGTVKIMDFGIAKSMVSHSTLTQTGITLGTASYLAPEQIRGEDVDPRTDIFSMGVLAYELFTLQKPFIGEHISTVLYKILNEQPPLPHLIDPTLSETLSAIVMKAIEKNRENRQASCSEMRNALAQVAQALPLDTGGGFSAPEASFGDLDKTVITPTGGFSNMVKPHLQPNEPRPPAAELGLAAISPAPLVSSRPTESLADVRIRGREETASAGVTSASARSGGALKIFIGSLVLLIVAGGGAFYLYRHKAPASSPPQNDPAPAGTPLPVGSEATSTSAPSTDPVANVSPAFPSPAVPTPAQSSAPTAAARSTPIPIQTGSAEFSANYYSELTLDGQRRKGVERAVRVNGLKLGRHRAVFQTEGFSVEKSFEVRAGEITSVKADFPARGKLKLSVPPEVREARFFLDGKPIGLAPLTVKAGSHELRAVLDGFEPWSKTVDVIEQDVTVVPVKLIRKQPSAS